MERRTIALLAIGVLLTGFVITAAIYSNIRGNSQILHSVRDSVSGSAQTQQSHPLSGMVVVEALQSELFPKVLNNFNDAYDVPMVRQSSETVRIPVLLYHHIGPNPGTAGERVGNVSLEIFRQQMAHLKEKGYKTLSIDEFIELVKSGSNPLQKSILLSFDDGYLDNYTNAFPILKEFGFRATFFIPPKKSEINPTQIKEMSDAGMDIESHTTSHWSMAHVADPKIWTSELLQSKVALETITGKPVKALAYPYCVYNKETLAYLEATPVYEIAFQCGNTKGTSIDTAWGKRFELYRSWTSNDLQNFKQRISGHEDKPVDRLPDDPNGSHVKYL